jgi:NAD(P)-dependent dehydrogenase (short-subunit alcohol dehydrogenase family)
LPESGVARGTAIVTGGRRGIGGATGVALAKAGFDVVLVDVIEDEAGAETLELIETAGGRALFLRADVADIEMHEAILDRSIAAFGPVTCLVNNAGRNVPVRGDMLETTPLVFDQVMGLNLRGTFFLTQRVAKHMLAAPSAARRSIIVVSSANAAMTSPEKAAYCLSKSALPMLTRLFAARLGEAEIDVFEIQPGLIRTRMSEAVWETYGKAIAAGASLTRRWGEAEDVGQAIASLATGALPFSTGTMVPVGGGLHVHRL